MKKFLVIAISALMITTVVGCSSKSGEEREQSKNAVEENINVDDMAHFGKVKSILGNEVEIEIASREILGMVDEGEEEIKEGTPAATMTPASTGENKEAVSGDANNENLKLEYTGDIENVIIPGGITIMDLRKGKDGNISDIKDGSVIMVYINSTSESISKIEILE